MLSDVREYAYGSIVHFKLLYSQQSGILKALLMELPYSDYRNGGITVHKKLVKKIMKFLINHFKLELNLPAILSSKVFGILINKSL